MLFENKVIYSFSENNSPIETIDVGETVIIEVNDTFNNQLSPLRKVEELNFEKLNPATGPFYVHQALPKTMLKVRIHEINLDNRGVGAIIKGLGVLGGKVQKNYVFEYEIKDNYILIGDKKIKSLPFISIIGVCPNESSYPCGVPHNHGGKLDCPHIREKNIIYLPVNKKGAYLSLGGIKASQGYGELGGTGVECSGEVKFTVDVTNKFYMNLPIVLTESNVIFLYSEKDFEVALERLSNEVACFLMEQLNISFNEAYHYLSIIGSLEIYQLVNPNITIGLSIPRYFISNTEIFR